MVERRSQITNGLYARYKYTNLNPVQLLCQRLHKHVSNKYLCKKYEFKNELDILTILVLYQYIVLAPFWTF